MRTRSTAIYTVSAGSIAAAIALGVVPRPMFDDPPPARAVPEHQHALASASSAKSRQGYARWKERHEAQGGDHRVRLSLGPARAHRATLGDARGVATLDLIAGRARVEVRGPRPTPSGTPGSSTTSPARARAWRSIRATTRATSARWCRASTPPAGRPGSSRARSARSTTSRSTSWR
ncbi:MAG: hypothetical protein U1F43_09965 [Myxococcota bacterium]